MSKDIAVPDYLRAMMDQGEVQNSTQNMLDGAGGVPRLTTRGKTFRFKSGEDEVKSGQEVSVIIVGMNPEKGLAHTYYANGYTPDASSPPDCSSTNGITPDAWISNPINDKCVTCPNQVWGSAQSMSGGKAKACRDSKHLYIAKAKEFAEDPDNCTLYLLQVTVNSLKDFAAYGKTLMRSGFPGPQFVITKIFFDDEASVPKLKFECLGALNEHLGKVSNKRNQEKSWEIIPAITHQPSQPTLPVKDDDVPFKADESSQSVDELINNW